MQYVDLFSGCGGISLGLCNAGLGGVFAVEKHPDAFLSLKHNLIDNQSCFEWPGWLPLKNWDINDLLKTCSAQIIQLRGQIDIVVGGPPCQGFSVAGQRRATDRRNKLIHSYLKFVELIQPRVILFENVRGFTLKFSNSKKHSKVAYSEIVLQELNELGYTDAHGEMVNFVEYGVPQRRRRFLVIATRENSSKEIFSQLEGNRESFLSTKGIGTTISSRSALSDLERRHGTTNCPDSPRFFSGIVSEKQTNFQKILRLPDKTNYVPDSHRFVNHTPAIQKVFELLLEKAPRNRTIKGKERELYGFKKRSLMVLDPEEPTPTITTIPDDFVHYSEPRVMTVRECARLQTFPDWFEFKGPYTTGNKERVRQVPRYTQVGNAVPPLFAEQLGIAITQVLSRK
ncbi:MAG: DNA cytosine methyltransferase [Candidatus Electryonea clarkiae]|nr:DNA cytosine methyltransferase [Candidatus Electryonea clarkiae]